MDQNSFLKEVSDADSETLLLSSQVMLNELAIRYLKSRQKDKESEQTTHNNQHAQAEICECEYCNGTGYLSAKGKSVQANEHSPGWKYCPYCRRKLSAVR